MNKLKNEKKGEGKSTKKIFFLIICTIFNTNIERWRKVEDWKRQNCRHFLNR